MSTCAKRSVLNAPDREGMVKRAALEAQSAANTLQNRILPHTGGMGRPMGSMPAGRQLNHGTLGGVGRDPLAALARAVGALGDATSNALRKPQGPVGWTGGRATNGAGQGGLQGSNFSPVSMYATVFTAAYTEPMEIPLPPKFRPITVIAGLISDPGDQDRYFRSGVSCDWKFSTDPNHLTLRSIDGMTIGDPTIIQYTFIYFGYASNGL